MSQSDWQRAPVSEVVFFQEGPGLRNWQWTEIGMKVINGTNIRDDGRFDPSNTTRAISMEEFESKYQHFAICANDIVVASSGTLGKAARVKAKHLPMMMNTSVIRFRTSDSRRLADDFLFAWLRSRDFLDQALGMATGAAQQNFGPSHIKRMTMPLPPLGEQRRIAAILSAYDDLIENNTRCITILEEMARRIYEEWFVRFRFPGHEHTRMIDSDLGPMPEGWAAVKLGQLAEINARSVRRGMEPGEIRYVDISSVSTSSIDKKETMSFADAPGRARRIVRDGDVIWACVRPNRKSYALVLDPDHNLLVSTGFAVLTPVNAPWTFVYQCVTTNHFVSYLVNHAKGAAYPAVGAEEFENARVLLPKADLLRAFDELSAPMMRLVATLQRKNTNLRTTRDLLLPKLISGELDVSDLPEPRAASA